MMSKIMHFFIIYISIVMLKENIRTIFTQIFNIQRLQYEMKYLFDIIRCIIYETFAYIENNFDERRT